MTLWRSPSPVIVQQFVDAVESSCSSSCSAWPPQHTHPRHKSAALNVHSVHPSRPALARSRVSPVTVLGRLCSAQTSAVVCQPSSHTAQPSQLCHRYRISSSQRLHFTSLLTPHEMQAQMLQSAGEEPGRPATGRRPDGTSLTGAPSLRA